MSGCKDEKEFYSKYPSENSFFEAFPQAVKYKNGGESYPQAIPYGYVPKGNFPMVFQEGGAPIAEEQYKPTFAEQQTGSFVRKLKTIGTKGALNEIRSQAYSFDQGGAINEENVAVANRFYNDLQMQQDINDPMNSVNRFVLATQNLYSADHPYKVTPILPEAQYGYSGYNYIPLTGSMYNTVPYDYSMIPINNRSFAADRPFYATSFYDPNKITFTEEQVPDTKINKILGRAGKVKSRTYSAKGDLTKVPIIQDPGKASVKEPIISEDSYGPYRDRYRFAPEEAPITPIEIPAPLVNNTYDWSTKTDSKKVANTVSPIRKTFDFNLDRMLNQISKNEAFFFGTERPNPLSVDWREQQIQGDFGMYSEGNKTKEAFDDILKNVNKKYIWDDYADMPAPLKDIAGDHLFNSSTDPRIFTLAAAGVIDWNDRMKYKNDLVLLDKTWKDGKQIILDQYNDDPQAFTSSVSDYRKMLYAKTRTYDNDIPSNSGTPGLQYNAWAGRSDATQKYIDETYFKKNGGAVKKYQFGEEVTPNNNSLDYSWNSNMGPNYNDTFNMSPMMTVDYESMYGPNTYADTPLFKEKRRFDPTGLVDASIAGQEALTSFINQRDVLRRERDLRKRTAADSIYRTDVASTGDYDVLSGAFRPDSKVPVQYTQTGGSSFLEGNEYYLTEEMINQILANGGEIEYLD